MIAKQRLYTTALLVVGIFIWQMYATSGMTHLDGYTLSYFGARKPNMGFPQAPWRLLSSIFLHASWWHLVSNLAVIYFWGACLERLWGSLKLASLFLLTGFAGSLCSDIYGPRFLALGASGSAFGLLGAILALSVLAPKLPKWQGQAAGWRAVSMAALALNIVAGLWLSRYFVGLHLDQWAHVGGFCCGLALATPPALGAKLKPGLLYWLTFFILAGVTYTIVALRPVNPFT